MTELIVHSLGPTAISRPSLLLFALLACLRAAHGAEPAPPWEERLVTLVTPTGSLFGTELIPSGSARVPVVFLHAGSGPTDRDGNSTLLPGANNSLKQLAEGLARAGLASLRFDKRGIAASAPAATREADLRFETYVGDAAAWIERLRGTPRFSRIVVAGHSEGALIGMLAARRGHADAFVSINGPARAADAVLDEQLKAKLPVDLYEENRRILRSLKQGTPVETVPPALAALYRPSVQPYLISWFRYTPSEVLASLKIPVLLLQGGADVQVAASEARALAAAHADAKLIVIEDMNHLMKMVGSDASLQARSYTSPEVPISPRLVAEIAHFATAP